MRTLLLIALFGLAACSSVSQTASVDGLPAYEARCGGLFDSKMDCNLTASEVCPSGYNPIDSRTGRLTFVCATRPLARSKPI
ncbi:MAG TPA: hypothetical protein VE650_10245 [Acetobacteraceae bacterium]|nr:hypothetical protein [Acetobacteraceae bacterium]